MFIAFHAEQLSPAAVTSYCVICSDESTHDDVTLDRKSTAKYACVDCGGDRMCSDCACAHLKQRLSRGHRLVALIGGDEDRKSRMVSFCVYHPVQQVIAYCGDCEKALCERCRSVGGPPSSGTCPHSTCCDLSTAADTGRAQLEQHEQVEFTTVVLSLDLWTFRPGAILRGHGEAAAPCENSAPLWPQRPQVKL